MKKEFLLLSILTLSSNLYVSTGIAAEVATHAEEAPKQASESSKNVNTHLLNDLPFRDKESFANLIPHV